MGGSGKTQGEKETKRGREAWGGKTKRERESEISYPFGVTHRFFFDGTPMHVRRKHKCSEFPRGMTFPESKSEIISRKYPLKFLVEKSVVETPFHIIKSVICFHLQPQKNENGQRRRA